MFGSRVTLFRTLGFTVRIDASWLLLAALIVGSLATGYFPEAAPGFGWPAYVALGAAGLVGLAASIVVHELSHSLVARRFGLRIAGITLFVFGGVAEMAEEPPSAKGEFWMALAGPAMSFAIAALGWAAWWAFAWAGMEDGSPLDALLSYLVTINLFLALFNLVPAFPLDGGRVLRALLWGWWGDLARATRVAAASGVVCGFLLMGLGAWTTVIGAWVAGLWWFLLGLFLQAAALRSARAARPPVGEGTAVVVGDDPPAG